MAYKLTGDQPERVFDNLRFLQDTILHLELDSALKEAIKRHKEKKELMEGNINDGWDKKGLLEHNKYLETLTQNVQYRLEEKAKGELILEMELERVKKLFF